MRWDFVTALLSCPRKNGGLMRRGTTPTITLTITNDDGSPCDLTQHDIHVTFEEKSAYGYQLDKDNDEISVSTVDDATVVEVGLSQEETLRFKANTIVRAQVRAKKNGVATASDIVEFPAEEILLEGEI